MRFVDLVPALSPEALAVLGASGFVQPTPVQEATIPLFCGNKDVAVDACTGSGKTLAFVLPVVDRLRRLEAPLRINQVGAVIVSPTRELARQIFEVAQPFIATVAWLRALLLVGGSDPAVDVGSFKENGGHVLIGTPGRLDDIMQRCSTMDLRTVEVLVLDEADRLLDMGFKVQLDAIMQRLPRQRRTGLFSATQTEAVEALARAGLRNPVRVNVAVTQVQPPGVKSKKQSQGAEAASDATQRTPSTLHIQYILCEATQKLPQLVAFLQAKGAVTSLHSDSQGHQDKKVIVYFLTCACVDFVAAVLPRLSQCKGMTINALHGRMKQAARAATLAAFTEVPAGVLLCTDVAARGLDIPDVQWIVQFDPPQDPSAFVHRVGRTARMGRSGNAVVYLLPHEASYVDFLRVRKIPLQQAPLSQQLPDLQSALQRQSETDRLVMEAGTKAFVSYVRAYKEHHCKFIFRLQDLALGRLATAFALLRLPGMPEIKKGKGLEGFTPSAIDPDSVRFKDKAREKQRQVVLKQQQQRRQEEKVQRRQQRKQAVQPEEHLPAAKRRKQQDREDLLQLQDEYTLLRKVKKGKMSASEFDAATGLDF
ncbi:DEAD-box ATP-dependent RNA helicase 18 isoform A [Micractinium conductrix]|uniref:ATP-dependent RNA helicase n=1 Tax=Micractinium conductrix TaxID=554055 RepID=A0A2P6VKE0_9CHLO|nr:DEAD-box ATP-dependent RNA helicase 18 isoform A [Micractinium conductrix]|eukprot:PSC74559.1 DEAD-box ATP-dependent RNA helicase 18 isoform A [Micractinium conductrix]